ncbi:MAG TPA: hypothetical protein VLG44_04945 [Chlamydiales bacterium]|nr:hypothetical protein [Chlamydiales bacterium]
MPSRTIATFGEAERGEYHLPYLIKALGQLVETLGNPPKESEGLHYAVQTLLFKQHLLYFRVQEEGFSVKDYLVGLKILEKADIGHIDAICLPGVGDSAIIHAAHPVCKLHKSLIIMNEKDLYDYLTYIE